MTVRKPTRAALLTPQAPGAIAVIAICGPRTEAVLARILRHRTEDRVPTIADFRPTLCRIVDEGATLDDAIVTRVERNGEVAVELSTHGGVRIVQRTLLLLERHGAEITRQEHFPAAWRADNPSQREIDGILLGVSARRLTEWLLAQRTILPPYLARRSSWSREEAESFRARSEIAIRLIEGLHVAIIGSPNAGKSTLANRLIGRDRIIASETPGTTRDWVSETALIRGWPVTLTDTAGIRETECAIESEAIRRGSDLAGRADLVVLVMDATSRSFDQNADALLARIPAKQPRIGAVNKTDLIADQEMSEIAAGFVWNAALFVSALTGSGIEEFEAKIASVLCLDLLQDGLPTACRRGQLEAS